MKQKIGNRVHETYPDEIEGIRFQIGGFFDGLDIVWIRKINDRIVCDYLASYKKHIMPEQKILTQKEWTDIVNTLIYHYHVTEWSERYDSEALDGIQWNLKIFVLPDICLEYYGNNEYPPYWKEVRGLFQGYFGTEKPLPGHEDEYERKWMEQFEQMMSLERMKRWKQE